MIDLFGTAVTNGKREYRFKPCCPDSLLYLCVEDWSYPCSPGGHEIAMGSTKPMGQALVLWHLSACSPEALWPSRKESSSVAFQFILLPFPYFPHLCFKLALECKHSFLWTVWKVVIVCAFEYKPWWDWTTCLKCLLFFPLIEYRWPSLYKLMGPTGSPSICKSTIHSTNTYLQRTPGICEQSYQ